MSTFEFPWPPKELSPNARVHWRTLAKAKAEYKGDCRIMAYITGTFPSVKPPLTALVTLVCAARRRDRRRSRDGPPGRCNCGGRLSGGVGHLLTRRDFDAGPGANAEHTAALDGSRSEDYRTLSQITFDLGQCAGHGVCLIGSRFHSSIPPIREIRFRHLEQFH